MAKQEEDVAKPFLLQSEPPSAAAQKRRPTRVDPEKYIDHAYIARVWEGETTEDNIFVSQREGIWATTPAKTDIIRNAYNDWKRGAKRNPPLLIFTVGRRKPPLPLYGAALVQTAPIPGTAGKGPWDKPKAYGDHFEVLWLIKADDPNNLPHARYDFSAQADMSVLSPKKAQEALRDIKGHLSPTDELVDEAGLAVYEWYVDELQRRKKLESVDDEGEPHSKRKRHRRHIKAEYEQPADQELLSEAVPDVPLEKQQPQPGEDWTGREDAKMFDVSKFACPQPHEGYADPEKNDLNICVYDADYTELPFVPVQDQEYGKLDKATTLVNPVVRLYGCTKEGYTGVVFVRGFMPYFYVEAPADFVSHLDYDQSAFGPAFLDSPQGIDQVARIISSPKTKGMLQIFASQLSDAVYHKISDRDRLRYGYKRLAEPLPNGRPNYSGRTPPVYLAELVRRKNIRGYAPSKKWFIKLSMVTPKFVKPARTVVENGFCWALPERYRGVTATHLDVFEANIPYALRYMIDAGIQGAAWITVKKDGYLTWDGGEESKLTYAPIEVLTWPTAITAHAPDDAEWSSLPPLRRFTFDIECAGKKGAFPVPDGPNGDPVICIANRLSKETTDANQRTIGDVLFTWGRCAEIATANVLCYYQRRGVSAEELENIRIDLSTDNSDWGKRCGKAKLSNGDVVYWTPQDEARMLTQWRDFIVKLAQPHIFTGYNVNNFDLPYLFKRAHALGLAEEFDVLGLIKGEHTRIKTRVFSSKAYGNKENAEINIPGRVIMDVLTVIQRDFKQRSYTLNASAAKHLSVDGKVVEMKADVPHELIGPLWREDDDTRARVAYYCWKAR